MSSTIIETIPLRTLASIAAEASEGKASAFDHLVRPDGDSIEPDEDSGSNLQDFIVNTIDCAFNPHLSADDQLSVARSYFADARDTLDRIVKAIEKQQAGRVGIASV